MSFDAKRRARHSKESSEMGQIKPGPMCSTHCGPGWIDDGTMCRERSYSWRPILTPAGKFESPPWKKLPKSEGKYSGNFALYNLPRDLWLRGLESFRFHTEKPEESKIKIKDIITLIDFRRHAIQNRLWIVELQTKNVVLACQVAHGKNSGTGTRRERRTGPGVTFSNNEGSWQSSIGAYVTLDSRLRKKGKRPLGRITPGTAESRYLRLEGLDSTNSEAYDRYIYFHGAIYMDNGNVANSHGCFATRPDLNLLIIDQIQNGSFVFAYAGDICR